MEHRYIKILGNNEDSEKCFYLIKSFNELQGVFDSVFCFKLGKTKLSQHSKHMDKLYSSYKYFTFDNDAQINLCTEKGRWTKSAVCQ